MKISLGGTLRNNQSLGRRAAIRFSAYQDSYPGWSTDRFGQSFGRQLLAVQRSPPNESERQFNDTSPTLELAMTANSRRPTYQVR